MARYGNATVEARFLGGYSLTVGGQPMPGWRAGKAKALFQYLVVHRNRVVSRERLHEALWPGRRPQGSSSLNVAIHAVRCGLAVTDAVVIERCDDGYVLRADSLWTDFEAVEASVEAGYHAAANGDRGLAAEHFRDAVRLYSGVFLPDVDADWAAERREWLRTLMLQALTWLCDGELAAGDMWAAIRWCRQMLEVDNYAEWAYQTLVDIHAQRGLMGQAERWRSRLTTVCSDDRN